jgi:membrane protein DedA with SNARE-associated domain/membrane-associated phospholipid phosphatase
MSGIVDSVASLASPWAYVLVGLLATLEASAFVGLFVPGEVGLLAGGYIAYQGRADLAPMMLVAALGAIVGDSIGYQIGHLFGSRLRRSRLGTKIGSARWDQADAYLVSHGGRAVFLGRFIGVLRALVPALAGASRMRYSRFLVWNALGGAIWGPGLVLAGYLAGSSYRRVEHYAGRAGLLLFVAVVIVAGILFAARWVARHPEEFRTALTRLLDLPVLRRFRIRYHRQLQFLLARARPGSGMGLSLTLQLVVLVACGWAFGSVLHDVVGGTELVRFDGPVTRYVVSHRTGWLTAAMRGASVLGSSFALLPVVVAAGLVAHRRGRGWGPLAVLVAAPLGSIALYDTIKALVARPRPHVGTVIASASGFSFPSGHATEAVAALGALAYVCSGELDGWSAKVSAWAAAAIVALAVGLSRVYLGVHWLSDVLGGYALGAAWLAALLATATVVSRPAATDRLAAGEPSGRRPEG